MNKTQVIIIGAGAAGLMAARTLHENGVDFLILESTGNIGGRAITLPGNPHIEMGPEYLHGETPLTDSLMEEYHLPFYDLKFNYHLFKDGKLKPMPDFWERICNVLGEMNVPKQDMSFLEYLNVIDHHSEISQDLAKMFVEGFDAADLELVSSKKLKEMKDQVCDPKIRKLRRPLHGYGELMDKLSQQFMNRILFKHVVEDIIWEKNEVTVKGIDIEHHRNFEVHAEKVIDTVSVAILKRQNISPTPNALKNYLDQIEMGQVVKLIGELKPEFFHQFEDHAFPFVSAPDLKFSAWWSPTPIHIPTVTAWAGGERARFLSQLTLSEKKEIYIQELSEIVGKDISSLIVNIHHHDWNDDPAFMGAYSYPKLHDDEDAKIVTSFDQTLYLAGEAFHEEMSGTIEGALITGKQAAEKIARSLQ